MSQINKVDYVYVPVLEQKYVIEMFLNEANLVFDSEEVTNLIQKYDSDFSLSKLGSSREKVE